jgi:hypothetical protein
VFKCVQVVFRRIGHAYAKRRPPTLGARGDPGVTARGTVRSHAFRPQAQDADPLRDAKRLRPEGGTTNCDFHSFGAPQRDMNNSSGRFIVYGLRTSNDRTYLPCGDVDDLSRCGRGAKRLNVSARYLCPSRDRRASRWFSSIGAVIASSRARGSVAWVIVTAILIERSY